MELLENKYFNSEWPSPQLTQSVLQVGVKNFHQTHKRADVTYINDPFSSFLWRIHCKFTEILKILRNFLYPMQHFLEYFQYPGYYFEL